MTPLHFKLSQAEGTTDWRVEGWPMSTNSTSTIRTVLFDLFCVRGHQHDTRKVAYPINILDDHT